MTNFVRRKMKTSDVRDERGNKTKDSFPPWTGKMATVFSTTGKSKFVLNPYREILRIDDTTTAAAADVLSSRSVKYATHFIEHP
jgi:hypothetical protein